MLSTDKIGRILIFLLLIYIFVYPPMPSIIIGFYHLFFYNKEIFEKGRQEKLDSKTVNELVNKAS